MTDNNNKKITLKEAFDAELLKRLEENPPEIPTYEEFSTMVDVDLNKQRRRKMRIISIAASLAIVLLASIFAITCLTPDVDADKNPKEEIVTEDGVIIEDGGWGSSDSDVWTITEWERVPDVKKVYPEFLIPEYIPEGYEFEKLTVENVVNKDITSEFLFANSQNDKIEVEVFVTQNSMVSLEISDISRSLMCSKGKIYINEDNKKATIQIDDGTIVSIWNSLIDNELIKIVEGLEN